MDDPPLGSGASPLSGDTAEGLEGQGSQARSLGPAPCWFKVAPPRRVGPLYRQASTGLFPCLWNDPSGASLSRALTPARIMMLLLGTWLKPGPLPLRWSGPR